MNKLNPIYIIALFITILFVSFFLLENKKDEYTLKLKQLNTIEQTAKEYKELKSHWSNESFINSTLDQILKNRMFRNQKVLRAKTQEVIKIKIQSSDSKILDSFLNKVLNKKLIIKKLELNKSYINLEIGLK